MLLWKWMCRYLWVFISFGYIARSGIAGSSGNSSFNFLRNHHTAFHSSCTLFRFSPIVHSPISPHPCQQLLSLLMVVILMGVELVSHVVLVCISLVISDVQHLFKCWLFVHLLWKNVFLSPLSCLIELFGFSVVVIGVLYLALSGKDLHIFFSSIAWLFTLMAVSFDAQKFLILM